MKNLWTFIFLFLCFVAHATDVQFLLTDSQYGISRTTNATVTVQAENIGQTGVTLLPLRLNQITGTNGSTTFSNLYGSSISGFYHWTVAIYNSSQRVTGDMWVSSTNLGAVTESQIDIVNGAPTYPAGTWAWSAPASDLRYAQGSNSSASFVSIGQLLSTSNILNNAINSSSNVLQFSKQPASTILTNLAATGAWTNSLLAGTNITISTNLFGVVTIGVPTQTFLTNGFVSASVTNGLATTNFVTNAISAAINVSTNGLVTSAVTNGLATTNYVILSTNTIGIASGLMAFQPTNTWATFNYVTSAIAAIPSGNLGGVVTGLVSSATFSAAGTNAIIGMTTNNFALSGGVTTNNIGQSLVYAGSHSSGGFFVTPVIGAFGSSVIQSFGGGSFILGGNTVNVGGDNGGTIGGLNNTLSFGASQSIILGGQGNINKDSGFGGGNVAGINSLILGGANNRIDGAPTGPTTISNAIAGGYSARARHNNTFVWSDGSSSSYFDSSNTNEFLIRAQNGVGINTTNIGGYALNVNGGINATNLYVNGVSVSAGTATSVAGGTNITVQTNGTIYTLNVPTQTWVTNAGNILFTNALPALTNGFVLAGITNGLATTNFVTNAVAVAIAPLATTNQLNLTNTLLLADVVASTNAGNIVFTNQFTTNQTSLVSLINLNGVSGTNFGNQIGLANTNHALAVGLSNTNFTLANGLNITNYILATGLGGSNNVVASVKTNEVRAVVITNALNQLAGVITSDGGNVVTNAQPVIQLGPGGGTGVNIAYIPGGITFSNSINTAPDNLDMKGGIIFDALIGFGSSMSPTLLTAGALPYSVTVSEATNSIFTGTATNVVSGISITNQIANGITNIGTVLLNYGNFLTPNSTGFRITGTGLPSTVPGLYITNVLNGTWTNINKPSYMAFVNPNWLLYTNNGAGVGTIAYTFTSTANGTIATNNAASGVAMLNGQYDMDVNAVKVIGQLYSTNDAFFRTNYANQFNGAFIGDARQLTNILANNIVGISTNFAIGNTIFVDAQYGTANGMVGNESQAFALPSQANAAGLAAVSAGTISNYAIVVRQGSYFETNNQFVLTNGCYFGGVGNATIIISNTFNTALVPIYCTPGENCLIENLNFYQATVGRFTAFIGFQTNAVQTTNVSLINIRANHCDSDGFYDAGTNRHNVTVINPQILGRWDTFANTANANATSSWAFYGGYLNCSLAIGSPPADNRSINQNSGSIYVNGTKLVATRSDGSVNFGALNNAGNLYLNNVIFQTSGVDSDDIDPGGGAAYGISSCSTITGVPVSVLTSAFQPSLTYGTISANFLIPLDTNNVYGSWQSIYLADQTGDGTGGTLTWTNINNVETGGNPVGIQFGSDNGPTPGLNVINGDYFINGTSVRTNIPASGISTNGSTANQILASIGGKTVWTNLNPAEINFNQNPHLPSAVTLTGSVFLFTNKTPSVLECYFSGSVAYSVSKNGVGVFGSLAADGYLLLQPTNQCAITYTVGPTFYTNAMF